MTDTKRKQRTITLTGRPPVRITEDDWPVIASSSWEDCDSEYEFRANRRADAQVKVRQHADGRTIVYGTYRYRTNFQGEQDVYAAGGNLIGSTDDIPEDIRATVEYLSGYDSLPDGWQPDWRMLADDCIADLPAEEL